MEMLLRSRYSHAYASQNFIPKLKEHLLPRTKAILMEQGESLTANDWERVQLKHNRIFKHRMMHVNFTTYDV
jgi:hypothetical protein